MVNCYSSHFSLQALLGANLQVRRDRGTGVGLGHHRRGGHGTAGKAPRQGLLAPRGRGSRGSPAGRSGDRGCSVALAQIDDQLARIGREMGPAHTADREADLGFWIERCGRRVHGSTPLRGLSDVCSTSRFAARPWASPPPTACNPPAAREYSSQTPSRRGSIPARACWHVPGPPSCLPIASSIESCPHEASRAGRRPGLPLSQIARYPRPTCLLPASLPIPQALS